MILLLFLHLSIIVVCFTNTFLSVISRTSSRDSKHGSAVYQMVMFCIELVNITFKQGTLGLNEMYSQFLGNGKNKVMHRKIFAPQWRSYGNVALHGKYQNVK